MTSPADFTLAGYAAFLDGFVARGYRVVTYDAVERTQAHLVLRHDLDLSIQAARATADIEAARALGAHYFVLLRTELYNPWSRAGRADLHALADAGHDIGLHFDAALYADDLDGLDHACGEECDALEQVLGRAVTMVSLHRPRPSLLGLDRPLGGRMHTYQLAFFSDIGYCSDSRGAWHHGHPLDHPTVVAGHAVQLLTHPIWWPIESTPGPVPTLDRYVCERDAVLRRELAANCEPYREKYNELENGC